LFQKALGRLLGKTEAQFPLETSVPETRVLGAPEFLRLSLCQGGGEALTCTVAAGDEIDTGQVVATGETGFVLPSSTAGTVKAITQQPDIRGDRKGGAILIKPSETTEASSFERLDPETATPEVLSKRLHEAGVLSALLTPVPLLAQLRSGGEFVADRPAVETLVVLAADGDPGVSIALQLLRERSADVKAALRMLGRIAGAERLVVALPEGEQAELPAGDGVELLPLPAEYPKTLAETMARRLGTSRRATSVIPLETALVALDAVREGRVQAEKLLTLIGPDQTPIANYRVRLGTQIREVLADAGIEMGERDKIIAGGPLRGFALFSLDGSIDAGVDALTVVRADQFPSWSVEPCINCGTCIDACPINLQVQLIARYAEFELFDRTPELHIDECFECGLCAVVCTARRPLLQYIRLAKQGLEVSA